MTGDAVCTASALGLSVTASRSNLLASESVSASEGGGISENSLSMAIDSVLVTGVGAGANYVSRRRGPYDPPADSGSHIEWVPFNGANIVSFTLNLELPETNPAYPSKEVRGYKNVFATAQLSNSWFQPTEENIVYKTAASALLTAPSGGAVTASVTAILDPPSITVSMG
jgi:hypothetical protein